MPRVPHEEGSFERQTDRLVFLLRERVLQGEFTAGERLTELGLVPLLGASRTPVRLALERLSHDGLLDALPSGGFRVRSFTLAEVLDAVEIRGVLEGTAARFAAERLESAAELAHLKSLVEQTAIETPITAETFARYLEKNDRFHAEIWRLAKSAALMRALETICKLPFAAPGSLVFTDADRDPSIRFIAMEHHRAISEAIEQRAGARAEALAREHSRISRRNLEWALQQDEAARRVPGASLITM